MRDLAPLRFLWLAPALLLTAASARASTITVNSTADTAANDGACTLREAIIAANMNTASGAMPGECAAGQASPTVDTIAFNIPGAGLHTITPATLLPQITERVIIDGGNGGVASNRVELSGAGALGTGLALAAGNSAIRNLVINGFTQRQVLLANVTSDTIQGNFLGLNAAGTAIVAGSAVGIEEFGSSSILIGGTSAAARNVISSATGTLAVTVDGNATIQGNFIGLNASGTAGVGNPGTGVQISNASATIGGTNAGEGNVIVAFTGIRFGGNPALGHSTGTVQGNLIGTDVTGTVALNLGNGSGVDVDHATGVLINGGNVISGNGDGITMHSSGVSGASSDSTTIQGNFIGTAVDGVTALGNSRDGVAMFITNNNRVGGINSNEGNVIAFNGQVGVRNGGGGTGNPFLRNSIFSNGALGISLSGAGTVPTANDACDADTGANNLQNYPLLTTASSSGGNTNIQGTLNSVANTTYRIEFFSNDSCDPSLFGEGQTYLGFAMVPTDNLCNGSFNVDLPVSVSPQARLTATATDPAGNTSEFSSCISLQAQYHTVTPCRVLDTRNAPGPYGGPALAASANRTFVIGGQCGIPPTAQAVAFNLTITQPTGLGDLRTFPGGGALPLVSTMNWRPGQTRANNAIVPLGTAADIVVHIDQAGGTVHFIADVNGYFE